MDAGSGEEVVRPKGQRYGFRRRFWPTFFAVYFGIRLLPEWFLSITGGDFWLFYDISWVLVVVLVLALLLHGILVCAAAPLWGKAVSVRGRRSLRIAGQGMAIGLASVLLLHAVRRGLPAASYVLEFDRDLWLAETECRHYRGPFSARQLMCGSLMDRLEPGMTMQELYGMLGRPRSQDFDNRTMTYPLGTIREPLASDSEWLLVRCDDDDRFQACEIHR